MRTPTGQGGRLIPVPVPCVQSMHVLYHRPPFSRAGAGSDGCISAGANLRLRVTPPRNSSQSQDNRTEKRGRVPKWALFGRGVPPGQTDPRAVDPAYEQARRSATGSSVLFTARSSIRLFLPPHSTFNLLCSQQMHAPTFKRRFSLKLKRTKSSPVRVHGTPRSPALTDSTRHPAPTTNRSSHHPASPSPTLHLVARTQRHHLASAISSHPTRGPTQRRHDVDDGGRCVAPLWTTVAPAS